jgi:hypothetical protein
MKGQGSLYRVFRRRATFLLGAAFLSMLAVSAASLYYEYRGGKACARCHEIWQPYTDWHSSTHRNVPCSDCHGSVFTIKAGFHINNMRTVVAHLRGEVPEKIHLRHEYVLTMISRCGECHQQELADWSAGPHGLTYAQVFLDKSHNQKQVPMDDCFRCLAMYYDGSIRDLIKPMDTQGPWSLTDSTLTSQPTIPCLSCHQIHHEGLPLRKAALKPENSGPIQEINRPSLAFFDRRELAHVAVQDLPLPAIYDGLGPVRISPDRRQALCYQCHAPRANLQVGSGDDRTPIGVHEGLSCFACHEKHGQQTRASCANYHPRLSNCGLDVEWMDTTFKSTRSAHNIHFVRCLDCHTKGVPRRRYREPTRQVTMRTPLVRQERAAVAVPHR